MGRSWGTCFHSQGLHHISQFLPALCIYLSLICLLQIMDSPRISGCSPARMWWSWAAGAVDILWRPHPWKYTRLIHILDWGSLLKPAAAARSWQSVWRENKCIFRFFKNPEISKPTLSLIGVRPFLICCGTFDSLSYQHLLKLRVSLVLKNPEHFRLFTHEKWAKEGAT